MWKRRGSHLSSACLENQALTYSTCTGCGTLFPSRHCIRSDTWGAALSSWRPRWRRPPGTCPLAAGGAAAGGSARWTAWRSGAGGPLSPVCCVPQEQSHVTGTHRACFLPERRRTRRLGFPPECKWPFSHTDSKESVSRRDFNGSYNVASRENSSVSGQHFQPLSALLQPQQQSEQSTPSCLPRPPGRGDGRERWVFIMTKRKTELRGQEELTCGWQKESNGFATRLGSRKK